MCIVCAYIVRKLREGLLIREFLKGEVKKSTNEKIWHRSVRERSSTRSFLVVSNGGWCFVLVLLGVTKYLVPAQT